MVSSEGGQFSSHEIASGGPPGIQFDGWLFPLGTNDFQRTANQRYLGAANAAFSVLYHEFDSLARLGLT